MPTGRAATCVDGRGLVDARLLGHVLEHEVAPPGDLPFVGLEERGLALRDAHALHDHLEQRRLAGPVGADQADLVAITNGERHAVKPKRTWFVMAWGPDLCCAELENGQVYDIGAITLDKLE